MKGETAKLKELQRAYEDLAHSHAELKQVFSFSDNIININFSS